MKSYPWRSYAVGESNRNLQFVEPSFVSNKIKEIIFVFSGQGPQHYEMGKNLYKTFPIFKESVDNCDKL